MKILAALFLFSGFACAQDPFQIHGYIQGRFTNQEGTPDRLEIRRARLIVSGEPLSQLSYTFQVDALKHPILMDALLTWKPMKAFHVTAGQFKIPFSSESLLSDNLELPIERAHAVNFLAPGRDTGVQARDTGVQVSGTVNPRGIEYAVGVFRGQTFVNAPARHFRAFSARVVFHPLQGVTVGGDWYSSFSASNGVEKRRWEIEGSYERKAFTFRSEQIWGRDGKLSRSGGYALAGWRFSRHWEGLTRAEWYRADASKSNSASFIYETGANYYLGRHVKIQANCGARDDQSPHRITGVFLAQTQLSF